jgi:hypothetical protein
MRVFVSLLLLAACTGPVDDPTPDAGDLECHPRVVVPASCEHDNDCPAGYACGYGLGDSAPSPRACLPACRTVYDHSCAVSESAGWAYLSEIGSGPWNCSVEIGGHVDTLVFDWCRAGVPCIHVDGQFTEMRPWYSAHSPCGLWNSGRPVEHWPFSL